LPKEAAGHLYRPLATYTLEEKIIEGLTARYLRTLLEKALLPSCIAFRCRKKHQPPPSTDDALAAILMVRTRSLGEPLYVAECDIKGFFDCVGHRIARQSLDDLIQDAIRLDPNLYVDPRAQEIFDAYLQSYSFVNNVRGTAQRRLRKEDPNGTFKWHEKDLQRLYQSTALPPIGVPHGGAMTPRTQKITSNLSGGWHFGGNRVRIDVCRKWLYSYDRCHARADPKRPSGSIVRGSYCGMSINSPMRSSAWRRTALFRRVKPTVTSNKLRV
jgi:hypothetical protein